jgi:DNA replication protein DnaD
VVTEKVGRVRTCRLSPLQLEEEAAWLERYRRRWELRFAALDEIVEELKQRDDPNVRKD